MATPEGFWYHTRVQFDHTDAQGRVFYAHYFRLLDQARCAYWEALGFSEDDVRQILGKLLRADEQDAKLDASASATAHAAPRRTVSIVDIGGG